MTDFFTRHHRTSIQLNTIQKEAVLHSEGPLLLLACPGSGKTTTLIMRIGYLIEERGMAPNTILAVTFSRAAATDMEQRFQQLFPHLPPVQFVTLHSLAYRIAHEALRRQGVTHRFIEGKGFPSKFSIIHQLYKKIHQTECSEEDYAAFTTYYSRLKNRLLPQERWKEEPEPFDQACELAEAYEKAKINQSERLLDFDDLLTLAEQALLTDDELRLSYTTQYRSILTDESQDTSFVQHRLIEHLVGEEEQLFIVADDDQSIYSWRGADPTYLLEIQKVYPTIRLLKMEQNYRSTRSIVETSARFIKLNEHRFKKEMRTDKTQGKPIKMQQVSTRNMQNQFVLSQLVQAEQLNDYAILYRNNASALALAMECNRRGIPFYLKGFEDPFFSHWIVQDILNFMRLAYNHEHRQIFEKVILKCQLYLSRKQVEEWKEQPSEGTVFAQFLRVDTLSGDQKKGIQKLATVYPTLLEKRPKEVIEIIRNTFGYDANIKSRASKFGYREEHLQSILQTLEQIAEPLDTMIEFAQVIKELENQVKEQGQKRPKEAVTLLTLHSSKGLEFKRVFIIDLQQGVLPTTEDEADPLLLEEARRLLYVGMTRAKEQLYLLSYTEDERGKITPSRFLEEIERCIKGENPEVTPQKQVIPVKRPIQSTAVKAYHPKGISKSSQLHLNQSIKHPAFGIGVIQEMTQNRLVIQFDTGPRIFDQQVILRHRILQPHE